MKKITLFLMLILLFNFTMACSNDDYLKIKGGEVLEENFMREKFAFESKFIYANEDDLKFLKKQGVKIDDESFSDKRVKILFDLKQDLALLEILNREGKEYSGKMFEKFILETKVENFKEKKFADIKKWYYDSIDESFIERESFNRQEVLVREIIKEVYNVKYLNEVSNQDILNLQKDIEKETNEKNIKFKIKDKNLNLKYQLQLAKKLGKNSIGNGEINFKKIDRNTVEIKAKANKGYKFKEWKGQIEGNENPQTINLGRKNIKDLEIIAIFN